MKANAYGRMAQQERGNWFYLARGRAVETLIRRYVLPVHSRPKILDVGCGTGGTSALLAKFGTVRGIEPSSLAIEFLNSNYPDIEVVQGTVQELRTLIPTAKFDLVTVLGVLYHRNVPDPQAALDEIAATLHEEGWILWGDCVYPCLARGHDEFVESGRRFYPAQMHRLLQTSGFEIVFSSHFLGWGFPVGLALAMGHRLKRRLNWIPGMEKDRVPSDDRTLPRWINSFLCWLTFWEWRTGLWGLKSPWGISRLILARKRASRCGTATASHCETKHVAVSPCR